MTDATARSYAGLFCAVQCGAVLCYGGPCYSSQQIAEPRTGSLHRAADGTSWPPARREGCHERERNGEGEDILRLPQPAFSGAPSLAEADPPHRGGEASWALRDGRTGAVGGRLTAARELAEVGRLASRTCRYACLVHCRGVVVRLHFGFRCCRSSFWSLRTLRHLYLLEECVV